MPVCLHVGEEEEEEHEKKVEPIGKSSKETFLIYEIVVYLLPIFRSLVLYACF